jgi:hypothetical protein
LPLDGAGCKLRWREPFEARVRSVGVVVDPPFFDEPAGLRQVCEQMLVEALVSIVTEPSRRSTGRAD